jgi:hypothetical protein
MTASLVERHGIDGGRAIAIVALRSSGSSVSGVQSDPGVESRVPARATVRVGSKAEPRSGSESD